MDYRGFHSIGEYEQAARSHGLNVERIPFHRRGENGGYFILITGSEMDSPTAVKVWTLFPADESREIMAGIINGDDVNYLGKLAAAGYFPD